MNQDKHNFIEEERQEYLKMQRSCRLYFVIFVVCIAAIIITLLLI